jgi:hypothetical protein
MLSRPHRRSHLRRLSFALCCLALAGGVTEAQHSIVDGNTPAGLAPGAAVGSYALSEIEQINLYNGHVSVSVPLLKIGGRGSAATAMAVMVSPRSWTVEHLHQDVAECGYPHPEPVGTTYQWLSWPQQDWWGNGGPGEMIPGYGPGILTGKRQGQVIQDCVYPTYTETRYSLTFTHLVFTTAGGTEYALYDAADIGV